MMANKRFLRMCFDKMGLNIIEQKKEEVKVNVCLFFNCYNLR